jgi:signal peptidase II
MSPPDDDVVPDPMPMPEAVPDAVPVPEPVVVAASPPAPARLLWWLSLLIFVVDQATKLVVRGIVDLYESRTIIPGFLDIAHVRNEGVAFGLFNSMDLEYKWAFTTALALAALVGITYYARHIRPSERWARVGLSMILGGAFGNLIDRVRAGYVLDFVDVYVGSWHFWAFNVADACISIGAILVFIDLLLVKPHASDSV